MEAVTVSDNSVELEAKRKEDSSWHPCRVSLSSSGDSLIVNFGRQELDDMLLQKEEVLMHLRFRSMPLQVDDCFHIDEGERVLADRKSQFKILFHDAVVVKVHFRLHLTNKSARQVSGSSMVDRVRHSKRGCRCTFMIKWLDQDLEGQTFTLPSSSIMKLATKSISAHPIINKLLKPEKHRGLSYSSPLLTILEGTDSEIDLNKLLQKQIEQISNLADASKKDFLEDIPWRNKGVNKGQSPHKPAAESNACVPAVADHHNHLKRTTRSTRKLQINIEAKNQSGHTISMKEAFIQSRSHLSPLASRAALASSLLTAKKCLDMDLSSSMTASMFMKGKDSSDVLAVSIPLVSEASHAISPHISTQGDASCEPQPTKPSSCIPTKGWENENKTSDEINCNAEQRTYSPVKITAESVTSGVATSTAELPISRAKKSLVHANFNASSTAPIRLTRSATRKGAVIPNNCVQVKICINDTKRRMPGNKNQLSRSAVFQGNENLANEEENNSTHIIDSDSSEGNIAAPDQSNVATTKSTSEKMKAALTPCNPEIHILTKEGNKSWVVHMLCKDMDSGRSNQGQKRKAVHHIKQDRRFSPRNFLPRTRSQNKAQPGKYRGAISS
ncbi:PREDICTED: uncharacterized protein LOC18597782 isoform X2 [Theobroma cacao]|uniref:Uncharacterized protein LOC18597782 isoform X2 n=1 Tax=Theobroma cacao TaxID=3641 RepID=A0AB32WEI1_THECC|nr:PREDICTED: uncharacterized protein LOC18597782 isoform X2 [Theobroma cacao]